MILALLVKVEELEDMVLGRSSMAMPLTTNGQIRPAVDTKAVLL